MAKPKYHGWVVVTRSTGFKDRFHAEYVENGTRKTTQDSVNPGEVIEWWDKRVGQPVKLLPTPLGAYRVYTEKEEK